MAGWRRFHYPDDADKLESLWQSEKSFGPGKRMIFDDEWVFTNLALTEMQKVCSMCGVRFHRDYVTSGLDDDWLRELLGLPALENEEA